MLRVIVALAVLAASAPASADESGAYGRLEGDLTLEAALGGGVAFEGNLITGAGTLELRARYLDVGGLVLGADVRPEGTSRVWIGGDFRPIFLARFLLNKSFRDRYWDILFDSIGLDLGVAILPFDTGVGAALAVGFGIDVPLVFFGSGIEGISLRLAGRHVASLETDAVGPDMPVNDWIAMAALVVRGSVESGIASWEPARYELPEPNP